jgi:hypothetical protein
VLCCAVTVWRTHVARTALAPLIKQYGLNMDQFIATWQRVTGLQLRATLTWLDPANKVGQFQVDVPVNGSSCHTHYQFSYECSGLEERPADGFLAV